MDIPYNFDPDYAAPGDWARLYRSRHIQVVPARAFSEVEPGQAWKRPLFNSWIEHQEALVPDEVFDGWYGPQGKYVARLNMGTICGRASDGLFVIDLDIYKTPAAMGWWTNLLELHNARLPLETVEQRTGGGGLQKLFRAPPGWTPPTGKTPLGVDVRGQGGFAMLAPSMHESGKAYEWMPGCAPDEIEIAIAPNWLCEAVDALIGEHGGDVSSSGPRVRTADSLSAFDAFGNLTDGREELMRDLVWAAVLDWRRECPIRPGEEEIRSKCAEKYAVYEDQVNPRHHNPEKTKTELLEAEGRGPSAFHVKWAAAMRRWDEKVAEQAKQPGKAGNSREWATEFPATKPHGENPAQKAEGLRHDPLLLTAEQFIAGFTPPAYLIDGIMQRGYLYSLTARTGHGKTAVAMYIAQCIARGEAMHGCGVKQGTVLLLAGENPDDIRARFLVLAEAYGFDPGQLKMRFIAGVVDLPSSMAQIRTEAADIPDLMLVIVDTAAAYFPGDETNSNSQQGAYARGLRMLTFLPGKPAVLVNCHPVKNAARDNLLPMGGSAFLNEVDGNLTLWANAERQTTLHWLGKFRGPEFNSLSFEIAVASSEKVKDAEGRLMPNAVAKPISDSTLEAAEELQQSDEDVLLNLLYANPRASIASLAAKMGANKSKAQRITERLKTDKLIELHRNRYRLLPKGEKEIGITKKGNGSDD